MKKMGCILLAGGMGTRLGYLIPKGCVPVQGDKTLFEILLRKIRGPLAIMTSPLNHAATEAFLEEHRRFGVHDLSLFQQHLLEGCPNGNGEVFKHFYRSGIYQRWKEEGIDAIGVLPVDDPLGAIEDLYPQQVELVVRCVKILEESERLGRVIEDEMHMRIVEYTEMREATSLGYSGQFACSMDFIERIKDVSLPLHEVRKQEKTRFETFVFDLFPYARSHRIVVSERTEFFAPIKDLEGLERARRGLA